MTLARKGAAKRVAAKPTLLADGNPQIASKHDEELVGSWIKQASELPGDPLFQLQYLVAASGSAGSHAISRRQSVRQRFSTWHILVYTASHAREDSAMQRRAKVFLNNRSQAVRLPKEFQFNTDEVFIRKEGEDVILSPRPADWGSYLESGPVASDAFMDTVEDLPVQEREP